MLIFAPADDDRVAAVVEVMNMHMDVDVNVAVVVVNVAVVVGVGVDVDMEVVDNRTCIAIMPDWMCRATQ